MTRSRVLSQDVLAQITNAIASIQYGSVQITIQDATVVQIEKAEKIRVRTDADLTPGSTRESLSLADQRSGGTRLSAQGG